MPSDVSERCSRQSWLGIKLLSVLLAQLFCVAHTPSHAEDIWSPGHRIKAWDRIEAIQRYPLFSAEPPDWEALCKDKNPFVRAAAALGIGRTAQPKLLPLIFPLLEDDWPCVRKWALWALLQIDSPLIKQPLLRVISSWEKLDYYLPRMILVTAQYFQRVGLPADLESLPLSQRQAWLDRFDADAWKPAFIEEYDSLNWGNGRTRVTMCLQSSHWDAGKPVHVRVRARRIGGTGTWKFRVTEGRGPWFSVSAQGEISRSDHYDQVLSFPRDLEGRQDHVVLAIDPDQSAETDLVLSSKRKPLPPGVYLFLAFRASAPVFVRVRRGAEVEQKIPELTQNVTDTKTVEMLGEQRVKAAVPALVEAFPRSTQSGLGFSIAKALGQIGDPAAVPVLLEHPRLRDWDVGGDTSRALKAFGQAAYPHYEKRIIGWKQELAQGRGYALKMSLRLLGPNGSQQADRARLQILQELSQDKIELVGDGGLKLRVFHAAVAATLAKHPQAAVEAMWAARHQPHWLLLDRELTSLPRSSARPILEALWQRLQADPDDQRNVRLALLDVSKRVAPEIPLSDERPITFVSEALRVLQNADWTQDPILRLKTAKRVEAFVRQTPDPKVQIQLARLFFKLREYNRCEPLLTAALAELPPDSGYCPKLQAYYYRGAARLELHDTTGAEQDLQRARDLLTSNQGFCGIDILSQA